MSLKFTSNTKNTLDIVVPVAGAGFAFYYLYKNKKTDLQQTAISAAIILVVLYVITTQLTKKLLASAEKPADLPITTDISGSKDTGGSTTMNPNGTAKFDADGWAKRLYDDISPFNWLQFGHDENLYADMILLSNQNLQLIYNAWQSSYYSKYGNRTLIKAMKDENYPNLINGTKDKVETILNRYASLGAS